MLRLIVDASNASYGLEADGHVGLKMSVVCGGCWHSAGRLSTHTSVGQSHH